MSRELDRSRPPKPGELAPLRLPELHRFELENGLRVHVAESHQLPEVSLRLIVEAGALAEASGQEGVAELTGRLLTEGAGDRTAVEMARWLDRIGAGFDVSVGYDATTVSLHVVSDLLEETLEFLETAVRRPTFAAEEVDRVRKERLDEIERELDRPEVVADQALIASVFGDHRYGTPSAGTRGTVSGLGRADVVGFHDRAYGATDAALVVCGDVYVDALRSLLEDRLGGWGSAAGRPGIPPSPARSVEAGRVVVVDRPGSAQAEIRLGTVGAAHGADDYYEAVVANAILGGLFNSRVNMNLREEKGWTYGARTSFHFRRAAGPWVGNAAVETPAAAAALEEFLAEVRGLRDRPPTEEELSLAKNALSLSLPRQFETAGQISRKVTKQLKYDLPEDHWSRFRERVEAVDREGVRRAVERRLDPDDFVLVVAAEAEDVEGGLEEAFGGVEVRAPGSGSG